MQILMRHFLVLAVAATAAPLAGQTPSSSAPPARSAPPQAMQPALVSPEVRSDRRITFRLLAPLATEVRVSGGDMPGNNGPGAAMVKDEKGVWEATLGPFPAGAYRYQFNVNGVATIDPRNHSISESNNNVWSLAVVPGSDLFDTREVPHGAVAAVTYHSKSLGRARRMHIYTPPGYESGKGKYPIFYLLHGAGDCDEAWTSVGRAGFVLDNLIAAGKAKPMIVVMPAGHTAPGGFRVPGQADEFTKDFTGDVMPYVESRYRVLATRENRAIAGLSMGGHQTLNIAIPHLDQFAYIGVYSSGLIQSFRIARPGMPPPATPPDGGAAFEKANADVLANARLKRGLKMLWFAIGKDDFLLATSRGTVELLKKHGFEPTVTETEGGHTWLNWRDYLAEMTPKLFR